MNGPDRRRPTGPWPGRSTSARITERPDDLIGSSLDDYREESKNTNGIVTSDMTDNANIPEQSADQTHESSTPQPSETPETNGAQGENSENGAPAGEASSGDTGTSRDSTPVETSASDAEGQPTAPEMPADSTADTSGSDQAMTASPAESAGEPAPVPSSPEGAAEMPADTTAEAPAEGDTATADTATDDAATADADSAAAEVRAAAEAEASAEAERARAAVEAMRPVWEELTAKKDSRETFEATVTGVNRGGIVADYRGVEIFIPQSHWSVDRSSEVDSGIVGNSFEMNVLEITQFDTDARRVTGTRRSLLRKEFLESLEPGMRVTGRVSTLTDFGAFVDIGGVDGLLHVSEISHARSAQPKDLLKKGEEVEVIVKKIEKGGKRISLGRKELLDSPWKGAAEKYPTDSIVTGTVVSLTDIGAFVQLEPGVDGLVRPRELSWTTRVNAASDVLNIGDRIDVMVLSVNEEDERIGLSLKRAGENPWPQIVEKFSDEEAKWEAEVREVSNKGAVVSVDDVEGFLPRGRMGRESNRLTELKSGDKLTVRVVEVDPKRPSVIFGLPMAGGGGGRSGGEFRGGGGEGRGGGRGRGGRDRDFQASPATPSNEMKSAETVSNFSLGDMLAEVLKEKLGVEEEQKKPTESRASGLNADKDSSATERPVNLDPRDVPVVTADQSSDTLNAPLSPAEFGTVDGGGDESTSSEPATEPEGKSDEPSTGQAAAGVNDSTGESAAGNEGLADDASGDEAGRAG